MAVRGHHHHGVVVGEAGRLLRDLSPEHRRVERAPMLRQAWLNASGHVLEVAPAAAVSPASRSGTATHQRRLMHGTPGELAQRR